MHTFNVRLNGKTIDTVFATGAGTIPEKCEAVRLSLIGHDGYDPAITVHWPKGQRVTADSFELQADYGHGWECVTAGETRREVRQNLKEYRENGDFAPMRIVRKLERI